MLSRPWDEVQRVLRELIPRALELSDGSMDRLSGVFLGLAGGRQEGREGEAVGVPAFPACRSIRLGRSQTMRLPPWLQEPRARRGSS
ncbi:hypothetical protein LJK88_17685 [Paenibacillus sp. P26]|nr:hypothetical protein LJK88_17685 [Paenibacillus sp. P26]